MNNETGQRLTEAIWALTNELRKQADKGPSHTGAAPFTSGDTVTVTGLGILHGLRGIVRTSGDSLTTIKVANYRPITLHNEHLTKADQP